MSVYSWCASTVSHEVRRAQGHNDRNTGTKVPRRHAGWRVDGSMWPLHAVRNGGGRRASALRRRCAGCSQPVTDAARGVPGQRWPQQGGSGPDADWCSARTAAADRHRWPSRRRTRRHAAPRDASGAASTRIRVSVVEGVGAEAFAEIGLPAVVAGNGASWPIPLGLDVFGDGVEPGLSERRRCGFVVLGLASPGSAGRWGVPLETSTMDSSTVSGVVEEVDVPALEGDEHARPCPGHGKAGISKIQCGSTLTRQIGTSDRPLKTDHHGIECLRRRWLIA